MRIYNFDPVTGRLLSQSVADADREQPGKWLLPAFATPHEPPSAPAGHEPVFDRAADAWKVQPVRVVAPGPAPVEEDAATKAKTQRDALLRSSDWIILRAMEQGAEVPDAWKSYRQALRDLTRQDGFPDSINWPQAPAA